VNTTDLLQAAKLPKVLVFDVFGTVVDWHRIILDDILVTFGMLGLAEAQKQQLNLV
jgi:hypothetical protein